MLWVGQCIMFSKGEVCGRGILLGLGAVRGQHY